MRVLVCLVLVALAVPLSAETHYGYIDPELLAAQHAAASSTPAALRESASGNAGEIQYPSASCEDGGLCVCGDGTHALTIVDCTDGVCTDGSPCTAPTAALQAFF